MGTTMQKSQRTMMMILPLFFVFFISRFPTGLVLYWVTTNLWTVGQGLITRRLMPKPGSAPPATGPKRSSRTPPSTPPPASENGKTEDPETPKPAPSGPRRVKKKGGTRK
jgi:YidC/Oxa1 family membrane protein insertase